LRITPCDECASRPVCRFTGSRSEIAAVLSRYSPFFEEEEAHLSFNCKYFVSAKEEVEG